jgi:hypothetical protein
MDGIMSTQFAHLEAYGRIGARGKSGERRHSIYNIVAEMTRAPHACPHIQNPQPPNILLGVHPNEVLEIVERRAERAVDRRGRKLRRDAPIVLVGVVSWPVPVSKVVEDPNERARYGRFKRDVIKWLRRIFGRQLLTCLEHMDESYPHLHFMVVPPLQPNGRMTISDVHPGFHAREKAKEAGGNRKGCDQAYCEAMVRFQDSFYDEVGIRHGLLRFGPRRLRLSRREWFARKTLALEFAQHNAEVERREALLRAEMAERERTLREMTDAAVESARKEMAARASEKAHVYFEHFLQKQGALSRELAEREKELAELRALIEEHGINPISSPKTA